MDLLLLIRSTPVIIELGMESQSFYVGLMILAAFLFVVWFVAGKKGGYGPPTVLNLKKGVTKNPKGMLQVDAIPTPTEPPPVMRDVTPEAAKLENSMSAPQPNSGPGIGLAGVGAKPPAPPPPQQATFIYNGHDWDAFEVLGVSPYSSFSEITRMYQVAIKKADAGKHEFLQAAYMAILKLK